MQLLKLKAFGLVILFLLATFCSPRLVEAKGFLHTRGQDIVDENGDKIMLQGVGLGNWLLPEGYMWKFGPLGDRPRKIEKIVSDLIGPQDAEKFWLDFRKHYITEADIKRISEIGFNSVRPALNARRFLTEGENPSYVDEGFELLDNLVKWCKKYDIYVIIDMHGAPGGQTGLLTFIFPIQVKDRFDTKSGKHKWKPSPYFKFNPVGETERDYGQPSTWIFLNKHHKNFQTGGNKKPWHYEFNFRYGSLPQASLDTTIGGERAHFLLEGLNVVSRGMVYYHRPGCWDEHPNFFNPFWRARLAPIGSALQNIFNKYVSSHITTGSDNAAIRYIINFLRNAIADVFFRTVTSVMTH